MHVTELWRHPVKSLGGERVSSLDVTEDGAVADREWGILDVETGRILTARREPRLLFASARLTSTGVPAITLPDGRELVGLGEATDAELGRWLGKRVQLVHASATDARRAEYFKDATDDASEAIEWTMPAGRFVDAFPVLVMTTAGLRAAAAAHRAGDWDVRRFRPNVLVDDVGDGWNEDAWCGRSVIIGDVVVVPRKQCIRCTMVTRAQPGLAKDADIFRTLAKTHDSRAGVWSSVSQPGTFVVGAAVRVGDVHA